MRVCNYFMICSKECRFKKPFITHSRLVYCTAVRNIESGKKEATYFQAMLVKKEFEHYFPLPPAEDSKLGTLMELVEVDYDEEENVEHFRESMGLPNK